MKHSILLSCAFLIVATAPAHAYIDPITGSFILQALIGGFAAASIGIKRIRVKVLSLLGLAKEETDDTEEDK